MNWIIGDVHGCGIELQQLVETILSKDTSAEFTLVGDLFDRAFQPHLVWSLISQHRMSAVLGNHERKLLQYLEGTRHDVPVHYHWALHRMAKNGVKIEDLTQFLRNLPYNRILDRQGNKVVIAHAGVIPHDPLRPDCSGNVYGLFKPVAWWDIYSGTEFVVYGHLSERDGSVRRKTNSIGIDTAACHGGSLTSYCVETGEILSVKVPENYHGRLKEEIRRDGCERWELGNSNWGGGWYIS